jgi:hypothetical protein
VTGPTPDRPARAPWRLEADAEDLGEGLGRLVVTLLEIVRELLERQAIRRVDSGSLSDEEVERLGRALVALKDQLAELREHFAVDRDDVAVPGHLLDSLLEAQDREDGDRGLGDREDRDGPPAGRRDTHHRSRRSAP